MIHQQGLGQIFAKTAIAAHNWYFAKFECQQIDFNDRNQRFEVWDQLRTDNNYNIDMVGMVLLHKTEDLLNLNPNTTNPDEIKKILARYNGFGAAAVQYGNETYEYYLHFSEFNR